MTATPAGQAQASAFVARVVQQNLLAQAAVVKMQINFGGGDAFVAQHLLDGTQIGAAFKQMCRKTVPKRMRRYRFLYSGGGG